MRELGVFGIVLFLIGLVLLVTDMSLIQYVDMPKTLFYNVKDEYAQQIIFILGIAGIAALALGISLFQLATCNLYAE